MRISYPYSTCWQCGHEIMLRVFLCLLCVGLCVGRFFFRIFAFFVLAPTVRLPFYRTNQECGVSGGQVHRPRRETLYTCLSDESKHVGGGGEQGQKRCTYNEVVDRRSKGGGPEHSSTRARICTKASLPSSLVCSIQMQDKGEAEEALCCFLPVMHWFTYLPCCACCVIHHLSRTTR